jgi:hypothetical protein
MSAWLDTPLTDLEPADRSSVRQCRQARQFFAGPPRLKTFSSITAFFGAGLDPHHIIYMINKIPI